MFTVSINKEVQIAGIMFAIGVSETQFLVRGRAECALAMLLENQKIFSVKVMIFVVWFCFLPFIPAALLPETETSCKKHGNVLYCCNSVPRNQTFTDIKNLYISNLQTETLNFNVFADIFPKLSVLSISGTNTTKLKNILLPQTSFDIKELHLSNLNIENLWKNFTTYFPSLQILNLTKNSISEFPNSTFNGLHEVYLSDNQWNCSKNIEWILELNKTIFKDLDSLRCFKMPHKNKPVMAIAQFKLEIRKTCTPNCSCNLIKCITDMDTDELEPIIEVNCSYRGLTTLPTTFPAKTKILHMEGNFLTDLAPLKQNLIYRDLLDIYLDSNLISDINTLEGSYWLTHFRVFSLTHNQLSQLPAYAIDNALQHNSNMPNAVRLTLGGNPWRCDCLFAPRFKEMLQKYSPQISDLSNIKCAEDSEHPLVPVIDISRGAVCHSPSEYNIQEALDLLNGVLGCLIFIVLGKLAYDYYYFKKTGRLPWIITKIP
ncbi:protein singed wings 2 isoform X1 [Euwallacea fornicatus]|uniref:protein singed wings 2 isoform X1 n=1 Tax=Euwallacea fornicatus TaxID=995702 RepID=UPI00338F9880